MGHYDDCSVAPILDRAVMLPRREQAPTLVSRAFTSVTVGDHTYTAAKLIEPTTGRTTRLVEDVQKRQLVEIG